MVMKNILDTVNGIPLILGMYVIWENTLTVLKFFLKKWKTEQTKSILPKTKFMTVRLSSIYHHTLKISNVHLPSLLKFKYRKGAQSESRPCQYTK